MAPNILGLDIGSSTLTAALFSYVSDMPVLKGVATGPSAGVEKGRITGMDSLQKALDKVIQKVELSAGCRAHYALVSLPCCEYGSVYSEGVWAHSKKTGKIKHDEKLDCVKRSQLSFASKKEATIMHTLPLVFKLDGQVVQNPVGIEGVQLEVKTHTILGSSATMAALKHWLHHRNITLRAFVADSLAHAEFSLTPQESQQGAILVDVGGRYTKVSIFEKNLLQATELIPIAGDAFNADIAFGLKLTLQDADKTKAFYTGIPYQDVDQDAFVELASSVHGPRQLPTQYLHRIVEARLKELFVFVEKALKKHPQTVAFPLILCGRGSLLKGIETFAQAIHPHVRLGLTAEQADHSCASGLVQYHKRLKERIESQKQDPLSRFNRWMKEFF